MKNLAMSKGAKTLIEVCAGVKTRENALIVTDLLIMTIAKSVAAVAIHTGAEVVVGTTLPRSGHGQESPAPIVEAMKKADVMFTLITYSVVFLGLLKL